MIENHQVMRMKKRCFLKVQQGQTYIRARTNIHTGTSEHDKHTHRYIRARTNSCFKFAKKKKTIIKFNFCFRSSSPEVENLLNL